jgi:hypothetical protein
MGIQRQLEKTFYYTSEAITMKISHQEYENALPFLKYASSVAASKHDITLLITQCDKALKDLKKKKSVERASVNRHNLMYSVGDEDIGLTTYEKYIKMKNTLIINRKRYLIITKILLCCCQFSNSKKARSRRQSAVHVAPVESMFTENY